jgi:lysine decarboxylase
MADCYGADEAIFLTNGTSSGILAMIMATVKAHEEIILARNVHKSVINALSIACAI